MGINIRGIATNLKTDDIEQFTEVLSGRRFKKVKEDNFENATSGLIEANQVFITQTERGSILTFGDDFDIEEWPIEKLSKASKIVRFVIGETSMVFLYELFVDGESVRSVVNFNGENMQETGEPLEIENQEDDCSEIIFSMIEDAAGGSISTLDLDSKSILFQLTLEDKKNTIEENETLEETTKPWWKFW